MSIFSLINEKLHTKQLLNLLHGIRTNWECEYCENKIIASLVSECEQSDCRACEKCPLADACLYYYTSDDSEFDEE